MINIELGISKKISSHSTSASKAFENITLNIKIQNFVFITQF